MRVMHTSDLHIGRVLMEESLLEDQQHILDEIIRVAREEKAEVLMETTIQLTVLISVHSCLTV